MFPTRFLHRNLIQEHKFLLPFNIQIRSMTKSKNVRDRHPKKRVEELETVTEKHAIISKFLFLFDLLKQQEQRIMMVRDLELYRRQIGRRKPFSVRDFLKQSPKLFELYKDKRKVLWFGLTEAGEELVEEEEEIIERNSDKAAEYVTRMLMMSENRRLLIRKLANFRRDLGLPRGFQRRWVHKYPELFKVVKGVTQDGEVDYLELVSWRSEWAITELEKKHMWIEGQCDCKDHVPGLLSLEFPMSFPPEYVKYSKSTREGYRYRPNVRKYLKRMKIFQKTEYLSPYADVKKYETGSVEGLDKRAVAVMHELLSFTIEKRLVTDHLTHFRTEFNMPQKLMKKLLKYFGIFYVSQKGKRCSAFLTEAYEGSELIHKHPLVTWREKVHDLIGYRKKRTRIETSEDLHNDDDRDLLGSGLIETEGGDDCMSELEGSASFANGSEMEIDESESKDESGVIETEGDDDCLSELEGTASFADDSEIDFDESESNDESGVIETEGNSNSLSELGGTASFADDSGMEINEVDLAYKE